MASAPYRDQEALGPGEAHRRDDVRHTGTPGDEGRVPVDRSVPHPAELFVPLVRGTDQLAAEAGRERLHRTVFEGVRCARHV